ncbi:MAG: hypothetical protein GTO51_07390 [Candidatus Latescibacteria bacterium]|nr:hypothetical protein [Candidatus Latescibacterota bacterium]
MALGLAALLFYFIALGKQGQYVHSLDFDFLLSDGMGLPMRLRWPSFNRNFQFIYEFVAIWKNLFGFILFAIPVGLYLIFIFRSIAGALNIDNKFFFFRNQRTLFMTILAAISFALFWTFPDMIPFAGYTRLNLIFLMTGASLTLVLRSEPSTHRFERAIAWVLLPLLCVVMVVFVHVRVGEKIAQNSEVIDHIPREQTLLFLDFKRNDSLVFQNPYKFLFCEYHLSKGGSSPYTFAWLLASPVKYRKWRLRYPPLIWPKDFNKLAHYYGYDYIIALGNEGEIPLEIVEQLKGKPFEFKRYPTGILAATP